MRCIVPRCKRRATKHHWPYTKASGGNTTIGMCRHHHDIMHGDDREAKQELNDVIIQNVVKHWQDLGHSVYRDSMPAYIKYMSSIDIKLRPWKEKGMYDDIIYE